MDCLDSPEKVMQLPIKYQCFIIMDILHLTEEQIMQSKLDDFLEMLMYSWNTFTIRRVDLMMGKDKKKGKDDVFKFDQSDFIGKMSKVRKPNVRAIPRLPRKPHK